MDGRVVCGDVLFFYKTLPGSVGAEGRGCQGSDEWPWGNIFTLDPPACLNKQCIKMEICKTLCLWTCGEKKK